MAGMSIGTEMARAGRRLARARTFTAIAVLTLALGAGALGTVYAVAKALFLDPLPWADAERIVVLEGEMRRDDVRPWPVGVLDLRDVAASAPGMLGPVPVAGGRGMSVAVGDVVEYASAEMVGSGYFEVFGLTPVAGRFFTREEELAPRMSGVVLGHGFRQRHFGDEDVIGRTLQVADRSVEVIGVAPPGFRGLYDGADLWLPLGSAAEIYQAGYLDVREFRWLAGVGRLARGATLAGASAQVETALRGLEASFPREYDGFHLTLQPLPRYLFGDFRRPVWILLAAAGLVLGIACTNLAGLLLVRGLSRRGETSLRRALGARRRHVVFPVVAELVLLVAAGGALGLMAADVGVPLLTGAAGVDLPGFVTPRVDAGVVGVTLLVSLLTGLFFGAVPALLGGAATPHRSGSLRGATGSGPGTRRLQATLVTAETALAILLLVGTGLLVRGLSSYLDTDLGFAPEGVTAMSVSLASPRYQDDAPWGGFTEALLDGARSVPGVASAALEGPGYPTYGAYGLHFWNDDAPGGPQDVMALRHHVTPGYFATLGIGLVEGRDFTASDRDEAGDVVIVSRAFADVVWPGRSPLGRPLRTSRGAERSLTVVGVVDDVRHQGLETNGLDAPHVYLPLLRFPPKSPATVALLVRTGPGAAGVAGGLREALAAADPDVPPVEILDLDAAVRAQTGRDRLLITLMALFAGLALALAAVGVYGVVAYTVEQSARDLGIRKAVGADRAGIVRHVLGTGFTPVAVGIGLGVLALPLVQRLVATQLYGVDPFDPLALGASLGTLVAVAFTAILLPALRAARVDPVRSLRGE